MIISASYKTDIPTFYGEWFIKRIRAGYCRMVNPYGRQFYKIDLTPTYVDGIVFWTKNVGPFLKYLPEIQERGYPFIVQHTINGYPSQLESRVTNYAHTVEAMKRVAGEYGSEHLVWRYDPIIFSSLTPFEWHLQNFASLAKQLEGTTDEVVISFAEVYRKTKRNVELAAKEHNFTWSEHQDEEFVLATGRALATELVQIAATHKMKLRICSQKRFLVEGVIEEARCVDADRLERVSGTLFENKKRQKDNRKECGCFASRDIGEYDTCPHGCVYCYAVHNRDIALQRYKNHDPEGEFLFKPDGYISGQEEEPQHQPIIPLPKAKKALKIMVEEPEQGTLF